MKILSLLLLFSMCLVRVYSQSTLPLRADTVTIEKIGGNANLKIKDATRDTLGVMTNIGGGVTRFKKPRLINDTSFVIGNDTIKMRSTDIFKRNDSVFVNNQFKFRDSVRWGIDTTTITAYSTNNKRNDATSIIRLSDGRLLLAYSAFQSASGDNDSANIVTKYSDDNGKTWQGLDTAVHNTGLTSFIPSLYFNPARDTLRMLFVRAIDASTNQIYGTYSVNFTSSNITWSTPVLVFGNTSNSFSPASDRVFKTKAGVYLYPLAMHISGDFTSGAGRYDGFVMRSYNGVTWDTIPGAHIISPDTLFVEGGFIQTEDLFKTITYYGRTRSGQVYISYSVDGGDTWSAVYPWGLFANNSTSTIKYIESLRLLYGAVNRYDGTGTINGVEGRRVLDIFVKKLPLRNVNLAIPQDARGGQWEFLLRIDSAENRQFIEPAIINSDNEILIVYSDGDLDTGDTFNLKVKRIPLPFLSQTAHQYAQQIVLNKTFYGDDPNFLEMYSNGLDRTKAYSTIKNLSSGNTSFGAWWDIGTIGQQSALFLTTHSGSAEGAMWINASNSPSGAVCNGCQLFRVTNDGVSTPNERFRIFGDGSIRLNNSSGEYARWFGATGNLTINTGGVDNGQKLQVDGAVRFDHIQAPPSGYNVFVHGLTDSSFYQVPLSSLAAQNISNTTLHANADYFHNWGNKNFFIDSIKTFAALSYGSVGGYPRTSSISINPTGIANAGGMFMSLRKVDNSDDSVASTINFRYPSEISLKSTNTVLGKSSEGVVLPGIIRLVASDSIFISAIPHAVSGSDSIYAVGTYDTLNKVNAIFKTPRKSYKVYTAIISQTGTGNPTATVLENTLGATITWTRTNVGEYNGALTGAFTSNKTALFFGPQNDLNGPIYMSGGRLDADNIFIHTWTGPDFSAASGADGFDELILEIRVYP